MTQRKKPGLGGDIDPETKHRIQSAGGKAQSKEAKAKGGRIGGSRSRRTS